MTTEEDNYVRFSLLMTGISPRAVRCKFNNLFPNLPNTVQTEYNKLDDLKKKKRITQAQWDLLYPSSGITDSNTYDVTLMICLMRNLLKMKPPSKGFDCLPPQGEISDEADLARIKFYRNYLAHLNDTKISNQYFATAWADVADAVSRLGGNTMLQECKDLKVKILDRSNKEIMIEIKKSTDEMKHLHEEFQQSQKEIRQSNEEIKHSTENLKRSYDHLRIKMKQEVKKYKTYHNKLKKELDQQREAQKEEMDKLREVQKEELDKQREIQKELGKQREVQKEEMDKLREAQKDPVPWNIRRHISKELEKWKKDDEMFVETCAGTCVLESLKTESCVTVTGSSGVGKTFTVRHVALQMAGDGYDILPVTNPDDTYNYHNPNKKTIFVIDNFCGTYTLNQNDLDKWKSKSDTIKSILEDKVIKIIVSCRTQVYQDALFKILELFTSCECNLMSEKLCLSLTERQSLAKAYLEKDASKISQYVDLYDCFPLLCKLYKENPNSDVADFFQNPFSVYEIEISKLLTEKANGKYCALALCVMFNNNLKEEWLTEDIDKDMKAVIKNTCEACKLEKGTPRLVIKDELESLTNTFIRKDTEINCKQGSLSKQTNMEVQNDDAFYCTIHDKLFDYLVSYFGKVMTPTLIKNGHSRIIAERFLLERQDNSDQFAIIIPEKYKYIYLQRMIDDWYKGHASYVFNNINMKIQKFRDFFLNYLTNLDPSLQNKLAETCDVSYTTTDKFYQRSPYEDYSTTTPLIQCCIVGDINMVQWFCDQGVDVNHCNSYEESPLYISCEEGHLGIVTTLLANKADANQCTEYGESPLYRACCQGHTEIVTTLLDNTEDVDQCDDNGESLLYTACYEGYTEIVTVLLDNNADVNQCTRDGESPLYTACHKGYTEIVTTLLDHNADVNQCTWFGESPLYVACYGGYTEIVTTLLDNNADVNQCTDWGESPLDLACEVWSELLRSNFPYIQLFYPYYIMREVNNENKDRYSNTVKLLMNAGAEYTRCNYEGKSPLDLFQDQNIIDKILSWK